ncbi:hypothetical protein K0M31_016469 [Melipona bicolor]|uniref:Uncharacterized protein n=1 Tax=Melipona bicolor TaxID=60889 RepID=A0AA40G791_9HYME|nr:hypothetical protein K0M31_016469 [Melipona bicolor]
MTRLCTVADIHDDGTGKGAMGRGCEQRSLAASPGALPAQGARQKTVWRDKESCDLIAPYRSHH